MELVVVAVGSVVGPVRWLSLSGFDGTLRGIPSWYHTSFLFFTSTIWKEYFLNSGAKFVAYTRPYTRPPRLTLKKFASPTKARSFRTEMERYATV